MRKFVFGLGLMSFLALASGQVHAQVSGSRSLGGGINPAGSSAFGGNSTSGAFNGSGQGSVNNAMGGNNGSSLGANGSNSLSNGVNNTGAGMSGLLGQAGQLGQNSYARQRQGQFVGADRQDAANPMSQANQVNQAASMQMLSQLSQRMRQQQQQLQRGQQQGRNGNGQQQLRIPMRLPLEDRGPMPISTASTAAMSRRLTKLPALETLGPIEVLAEGQLVILRGQVATEQARELAEAIARLEPGVARVKNELVVGREATRAVESSRSLAVREF